VVFDRWRYCFDSCDGSSGCVQEAPGLDRSKIALRNLMGKFSDHGVVMDMFLTGFAGQVKL
jgi:hypothetical protein